MKKLIILSWFFFCSFGLYLNNSMIKQAYADGHRTFDIHVLTDQSKIGGQPWDGPGAMLAGPFLPEVSSPPDLVVCTFGEQGLLSCLTSPKRNDRSACHNSFDCDWLNVLIEPEIFGITIIDLDVKQNDFVDAVILVDRREQKRSQAADRIEAVMRSFIAANAPALMEGEKERRERPFQRIILPLCEEDTCVLRQSRILFERVDP
ncbi:MAG: hypothetical protein K9H25_23425 [Rhodospirillum sp.]|nr:hypothetical protein [Rhodospirillum sp.]MCF8492017.1 hypothetical protein [Rhodospirillum sp.]MCF8502191.1 hypothetical protein [Rhodospirillum sp.]